jgi:hypothetical protein
MDTNKEYICILNRAFITVDMRQSNVTLLDLPDEILLIILKKLNNMDVLYSLLDIDDRRLDILLREEAFTKSLNFIITTITDDVLSIDDSTLDRFCINILPKIDYNIKSLILESGSMERILRAADYPNLTELKLYNVNDHIVFNHFTGKKLQCKCENRFKWKRYIQYIISNYSLFS